MKSAEPAPSVLSHRASGVLLHPTSLPGQFGIGDLGPAARQFIALLASARQAWWQMLPLQPPGDGNSPYQCHSAFAGNPMLISPEDLAREGLLPRKLKPPRFSDSRVDFARVAVFKSDLLNTAFNRFERGDAPHLRAPFAAFQEQHRRWLPDYTLFTALAEQVGTHAWPRWPRPLARREPAALRTARADCRDAIRRHAFVQFLFFRQLAALRSYAATRGVHLLADIPIFVSGHSADVWMNPHLFLLDSRGDPRLAAGVPPDPFSRAGQRWGNPLYDWPALRREGFRWWIDRIRAILHDADAARIDHFRGFAACWAIPASSPSAKRGRWLPAPGYELLTAVRQALGDLPLIAEDLGIITTDVEALRDSFHLPSMRVLHFAFAGNAANPHLPFNHPPAALAYTGTHDNATTADWYAHLPANERKRLHALYPEMREDPARDLIRITWRSPARIAITPLQDLFRLGREARMNTPGTAAGNWGWRWSPARRATEEAFRWLADLTRNTGRAGPLKKRRSARRP